MYYYGNHGRPLAAVYVLLQKFLNFGYVVNVLRNRASSTSKLNNIISIYHNSVHFEHLDFKEIGKTYLEITSR